MSSSIINVLLTTFPGLNLPSTLCLRLPADSTVTQLQECIHERLPNTNNRVILTTISNKQLPYLSLEKISSLSPDSPTDFLSLRLGLPLCGGKGGFGSQLRAAGGRMSSKPKCGQGDENASSRNLDGRRLRTVNEAKALAEYLTIKPDMAKREQEERRRRWEQVVKLAEEREEDIRNGKKGKIDGKWVEDKEEATERTRDTVLAVLKSGNYTDNLTRASTSSVSSSDSDLLAQISIIDSAAINSEPQPKTQKFFGFGDDDEFLSSDEDESEIDS
ncbi:hypothetical protein K3495_g3419 [Podosphaera aphanis]|nr:hypothetical protein K3495_g3419 [Podosphaera aphanis]